MPQDENSKLQSLWAQLQCLDENSVEKLLEMSKRLTKDRALIVHIEEQLSLRDYPDFYLELKDGKLKHANFGVIARILSTFNTEKDVTTKRLYNKGRLAQSVVLMRPDGIEKTFDSKTDCIDFLGVSSSTFYKAQKKADKKISRKRDGLIYTII